MRFIRGVVLAAPVLGAALVFGSSVNASAAEYFTMKNLTEDGNCSVLYSVVTNKMVTTWDRSANAPKAYAVDKKWGSCPKTIEFEGANIKLSAFTSAKIDGLIFTGYYVNGPRMLLYRLYGSTYRTSWIVPPKKDK